MCRNLHVTETQGSFLGTCPTCRTSHTIDSHSNDGILLSSPLHFLASAVLAEDRLNFGRTAPVVPAVEQETLTAFPDVAAMSGRSVMRLGRQLGSRRQHVNDDHALAGWLDAGLDATRQMVSLRALKEIPVRVRNSIE